MAQNLAPVMGWIAVKSLEPESEEEHETGPDIDSDELELCECVACWKGCRVCTPGDVVLIHAWAYHSAPHMEDGTLFVRDDSVVSRVVENA